MQVASAKGLVISSKMKAILWTLMDTCQDLDRIVTVEDIASTDCESPLPLEDISPEDPVFIQFTSGSTSRISFFASNPSCVLADIAAIRATMSLSFFEISMS